MMFVQRNIDGKVTGVFSNFQEGYAEEELPEDNPEILAFLQPPPTPQEQIRDLLAASGLTQEWQVQSAIAGMLGYAATQGIDEATLYATNPGYRQAKDALALITSLKAQIT